MTQPQQAGGPTPTELMTIRAARSLLANDVCFVGIGAPSAACNLARLTHAPGITLIYESGTIGARPDVLPLSIGDGELCDTALTTVSVPEMFRYWLQGGRISTGFLGGAQIDRFANLNTTVIGSYERPQVRLPGGGGAPEIAAHCKRVLIVIAMSRKAFVEKTSFVTSFGFGRGGADREAMGLTSSGPMQVITDLCVLEPDLKSRVLTVTEMHANVTDADIQNACGWDLKFAADVQLIPPPTVEELETMRTLHARTRAAHKQNGG